MDQSALQLIQSTAIAADGQRNARLPEGVTSLPGDHALHDLEKFAAGRRRFRGKLVTSSLADFATYVKDNSLPDRAVVGAGFVDPDKLAATVFFNLRNDDGQPGHADWSATLQLKPTAAYASLIAIEGKLLSQTALIDWLEDWHTYVGDLANTAGEPISFAQAIAAIRKIEIKQKRETVHAAEDNRASRSALDEIEAKSTENTPRGLSFTCEPYVGLAQRVLSVRINISTTSEEPRLILRIVGRDEIPEQIAQDFKRVLAEQIGQAATLTIGTFTA